MVRALGINLSRLRLLVFALGVALAALAGVVMAPIWGIRPHVGVDAVVPAFLIIVLGGVGSLWGAVIAGLMVGMVVGLDRRVCFRVVADVHVPVVHRRRDLPLARPVRKEERARCLSSPEGQDRHRHRRRRHHGAGGGQGSLLGGRLHGRAWSDASTRERHAMALAHDAGRRNARGPSPFDISDPRRCATATQRIVRALGAVDILVNNAGILSNNKAEATDAAEWRRVLGANLDGAFFLAQCVCRR